MTFLTADVGKLTGIGKGAKNSRRRFANCLDPFTFVRLHFRTRPNATLAFLVSCDLIDPPQALADPVKFAYASYLTELVDQLTVEGEATPDIFSLLGEGLAELKLGPATSGFLRTFELRLLRYAGYDAQLGRCHRCATPIAAGITAYLDPSHGRVLCERCDPVRSPGHAFDGSAVERLEELRDLTLAEGRARSLRSATGAAATQLVGQLLTLHLPRALRSVKAIAALHTNPHVEP